MERILIVLLLFITVQCAYSGDKIMFRWCAFPKEKTKCEAFKTHVTTMAENMTLQVHASCVEGSDTDDCIEKIKNNEADLVTLDGGHIYEAGKKHGFKVIVAEQYGEYGVKYFAVAVVRKNNTDFDIKSLKGKKSCHTGAGKTAGWNVPVGFLLREKFMPAVACEDKDNAYLSAAKFFKESCVPGVQSKVSPDDAEKVSNLCNLCAGPKGDKCSGNTTENKYADYHGAFKCMAEGKGDVAFVKYTTTKEVTDGGGYGQEEDYQYLCPKGGRMGVGEYKKCNLGANPAHAVVTRKGNPHINSIVRILTNISEKYGEKQTDWNKFQLFNSSKYDGSNLLFKDSATSLVAQPADKRNFMDYLGENYGKNMDSLTQCAPTSAPTTVSASTMFLPVYSLVLFTALLNKLI